MSEGAPRRLALLGIGLCLLTLVDLFLPWQSVEFDELFVASRNGLHGFGLLTLVAVLAVGACELLVALGRELPMQRRVFLRLLVTSSVLVAVSALLHFLGDEEFRTGWAWAGLLVSVPTAAVGLLVAASLARVPRAPTPSAQALSTVPGWYEDPERPGRHRWWDGGRWGMTDAEYFAEHGEAR